MKMNKCETYRPLLLEWLAGQAIESAATKLWLEMGHEDDGAEYEAMNSAYKDLQQRRMTALEAVTTEDFCDGLFEMWAAMQHMSRGGDMSDMKPVWVWMRNVTDSGLIFDMSEEYALAIYEWTRDRASNLRVRREYMKKRVRDAKLDVDVSIQWDDISGQGELDAYNEMRDNSIAFMSWLKARADGLVDGKTYSLEMLDGWQGYVKWMTSQSNYLFRMQQENR